MDNYNRANFLKNWLYLQTTGYCEEKYNIQVINHFRKGILRSLCRWWNRRSAIEPVIAPCKSEHQMDRNQLRWNLGMN